MTVTIALNGQRVEFRVRVDNRTDLRLAEVWCPVIGGLAGIGAGKAAQQTQALVPFWYGQWNRDLFRTFGTGEVLGVLGGEHNFSYPGSMSMAWACLHNPALKRCLYAAVHDPVPRFKTLRFGMMPGTAHQRLGGDWPDPDEVGGAPIGVTLSWTFHPYTAPGAVFEGPPAVFEAHGGGWRDSAQLYRRWFEQAFGVVGPGATPLRQKTAMLDTMFMLPEDNVTMTFRDIPAWARGARDRGVTAVLVSGWQVGGHDRGYPFYEPEPRLGTWADLEASIAACHAMGVRVYFFVNVQPADVTTPWYRQDLHRYRSMDAWGVETTVQGYGMGTLSARLGYTDVPMAFLSPAFPEVRNIFVRQMRRLAAIGADGVHIDKFACVLTQDFNPALPLGPDRADCDGVLRVVEEMLSACRAENPAFEFSYEGFYDRLMAYSDVVWWAPPDHGILKVVFPEWVPYTSISQPCAYNSVNLAAVRAQNLLVGPGNYQMSMDWPPMRALNAYIGEITRIREELLDVVSLGELLDASTPLFAAHPPAVVFGESVENRPELPWAVYRNSVTGRRALVIANLGRAPLETGPVSFAPPGEGAGRIYEAFRPARPVTWPAPLTVPAERVVFAVEESP